MMGTTSPTTTAPRDQPRPPPECEESKAPLATMQNTTETPAPPQDHVLASSNEELMEVTAALEKSSIAAASSSSLHHGEEATCTEAPSPRHSSPPIVKASPTGLLIEYYIRLDNGGYVHTYPDRGGPFRSLQEAQEAIDSHHVTQRNNVCMVGLSDEERAVRSALYWYHDGTRKHSAEAFASCTTRCPTEELVKALLDKHNEDNGLLGDHAYELQDIVSRKTCFDGRDCVYRSYSHFNLTMKTKGADANNNLYFAEVMCMCGDYEPYVLSCLCVVKPDDNGECHVCGVDMKHPTHDGYNHGRPKLMLRHRSCSNGADLFEELFAERDEAWLKAEEARVRRMIKEGKEDRCKLEVDKIGDDPGKKDKYVIPARR